MSQNKSAALEAYDALSTEQMTNIWSSFPSDGVLVIGNVTNSGAICSAAGGGIYLNDAVVQRVTNQSIPMYFCGLLRWSGNKIGMSENQTVAFKAIVGNYSSESPTKNLATGPYNVVWTVGGQFDKPNSGALSLAPLGGALGSWWWMPVVGALAAAVVE